MGFALYIQWSLLPWLQYQRQPPDQAWELLCSITACSYPLWHRCSHITLGSSLFKADPGAASTSSAPGQGEAQPFCPHKTKRAPLLSAQSILRRDSSLPAQLWLLPDAGLGGFHIPPCPSSSGHIQQLPLARAGVTLGPMGPAPRQCWSCSAGAKSSVSEKGLSRRCLCYRDTKSRAQAAAVTLPGHSSGCQHPVSQHNPHRSPEPASPRK